MRLFTVLLLTFSACTAFAQNGFIRGVVIDGSSGDPIIGGNIHVTETGIGTVTDLDGTFSIQIPPGIYNLEVSYIGFGNFTIEEVQVTAGEVVFLENITLNERSLELEEVVVTARAIRTTESALLTLKKKSSYIMDGISSSRMEMTGDATAVEAAKRVTGVSIENGKYVYIRGLGDRYSKTTLNHVDIPGLDPDRNTLQMDIFPTNLIDNLVVGKNFNAEMPADFTGGIMNVETKDFPEEKMFNVSVGTSYTPSMNLTSEFLTYDGGNTDFLGFDDGTRALPDAARSEYIPTPINGSSEKEVTDFINEFSPVLGARQAASPLNFNASLSLGNQLIVGNDVSSANAKRLGYIFSLSYKSEYKLYDDVIYGEYQRYIDPERFDLRYATLQQGQIGENNVLIGALGGLAYKNGSNKIRLTVMRLQNGENRAAQFDINNNGEAVGQSGYIAQSDNLEYNQRSLTNFLLNGTHVIGQSGWEIDWRLSPTLSSAEDPDIRKTAFTHTPVDTLFIAGAGGNPSRIWRSLAEENTVGKIDVTKDYSFKGIEGKLKFGASHVYKQRDYEILFFDIQFFGSQNWPDPDPSAVLDPENIFPNRPNAVYYQSGNNMPNPNAYSSNVNNTAAYISNEFNFLQGFKAIFGVRTENYIQRHTGRDQRFAHGDLVNGRNLDNEKVLESLDFFPSANLVYALTKDQNIRGSYSRTIARPSFKELSFAQILDPITNRIFNGSLFTYSDWQGQLTETRIDNLDLRWELFHQGGQLVSVSAFHKRFDAPIELVRIPEQQTSTEFQPRNVGNGTLYGIEFELRRNLVSMPQSGSNFSFSGNLTLVKSYIDMTETEYNSREAYSKNGESIRNTRQMAGQAPYVINAGLAYNNPEGGTDIGLFYNVKGETLEIVGAGLFPDVYFQPFHSLNFSFNKKLGEDQNTSIDFRISNILDDQVESLYRSFGTDGQVFSRYAPGRTISFGLSHNF